MPFTGIVCPSWVVAALRGTAWPQAMQPGQGALQGYSVPFRGGGCPPGHVATLRGSGYPPGYFNPGNRRDKHSALRCRSASPHFARCRYRPSNQRRGHVTQGSALSGTRPSRSATSCSRSHARRVSSGNAPKRSAAALIAAKGR